MIYFYAFTHHGLFSASVRVFSCCKNILYCYFELKSYYLIEIHLTCIFLKKYFRPLKYLTWKVKLSSNAIRVRSTVTGAFRIKSRDKPFWDL